MPAIPRGVRRDRFGDGGTDEALVECGVLDRVIPCHAVGVAPILVGLALAGMVRAVVTNQVRRIRAEQDGALAVHEATHLRVIGRVAAHEAVLQARVAPERDQVAGLRDGRALARQPHRLLDVERLVARRVEVQPRGRDQAVDLAHVEAGEQDVEIRRRGELVEKGAELPLVPVAGDLVQRDVEGFLALERQIDDADIDFLHAAGEEDLEALVAAHEVAGAAIEDTSFLALPFLLRNPHHSPPALDLDVLAEGLG